MCEQLCGLYSGFTTELQIWLYALFLYWIFHFISFHITVKSYIVILLYKNITTVSYHLCTHFKFQTVQSYPHQTFAASFTSKSSQTQYYIWSNYVIATLHVCWYFPSSLTQHIFMLHVCVMNWLQSHGVTYQNGSYYSLVYCGFSMGGGKPLALSWTIGFF